MSEITNSKHKVAKAFGLCRGLLEFVVSEREYADGSDEMMTLIKRRASRG